MTEHSCTCSTWAQPSDDEIAGRILRRAFTLTRAEVDALYDEWVAIPYADRRRALVSGDADGGAVGGVVSLYVDLTASFTLAFIGAALAVLARDSRSESGPLTPEHYKILTRPWRIVIGAAHPDDDLPTGEGARISAAASDSLT